MASEIFKLIGELGMQGADKSVKEMKKVDSAAKQTKGSLEDIDGMRVSATANLDDQASASIGKVQSLLNRFNGSSYKATAGVEANEGGLTNITNKLRSFGATRVEATAGVRADEGGLSRIINSLNVFGQKRVTATAGVNVDDAQLTLFDQQLGRIDGTKATATVDADVGGATAKLGVFSTAAHAIGRMRPTVTVDVDIAAAIGKLGIFTAAAGAASGASTLMTAAVGQGSLIFAALAGAAVFAMASLGPVLGAMATMATLGAATAGGMGLLTGAIYVMSQGLYDGGAAMDALNAKWSSMGTQMATALGPASVAIGAFALEVLGIAEGYIPLLGTTTSSVVSGMVANLGELLGWFAQGNQGFEMMSTIIAGISPIMADLAMVAGSLAIGMTGVFSASIPYAISLADYIGNIAEKFAAWATSAEGASQIQTFIANAVPVFQALWDMVVQVGGALLNFASVAGGDVAVTISTLSTIITGIIDGFTWLYSTIGGAGVAFGLLAVAGSGLAIIIGLIVTAVAALGAPVIAAIAIITGLAVLATLIYNSWGPVSEFFTNLGSTIMSGLQTAATAIGGWVSSVVAYFSGLGTSISTAISTALSYVSTTIQGWVASVGQFFSGMGTAIMAALSAAWGEVTAGFTALGAIIMPIVSTIVSGVTTAWQGLVTGVQTVVSAVTDVFTRGWQLLTTVIGPIILMGIALIIGILYYLVTGVQTVVTGITNLFVQGITMLWSLLSPIITAGIALITTLFQGLVTGLQAIWTFIQTAAILFWTTLVTLLTPVITLFITTITTLFNGLVTALQFVWTTIQAAAILFWTTLVTLLTPVITLFITTVTTIFNTLVMALQLIWTTIQTAAVTFWTTLVAILTPVITAFITAVTTIFNGLVTALQTVWTAIQTAAQTVWTTIQSVVTPIVQAIVDFITTAWTTAQTTVTTIMTAIQTAIETAWTYIRDSVITPILTAIQEFLTTTWTAIQTEVTTIWTAIQTAIETAWTAIQTFVTETLTAIATFLTEQWTAIQEAATTAWETVSTIISDAWTAIQTVVTDTVTAITEAIQSGWDTIVESATSFGSAFLDAVTEGFQTAVNKGLEIIATLLRAAGEGISSLGGVGEEIGGKLTSAAGTVEGYMFEKGGVVGFADGGGSGGMGTTSNNPRLHLWNEQIGPEAYIAKNGPRNDQLNYLSTAASWFGLGLAPFKRGGGAGFHDGRAGLGISSGRYVEGRRPVVPNCNGGIHGARCSCDGSLQFACGGVNSRSNRRDGGMPVIGSQYGNLLGWDLLDANGMLGYTNYSSVDDSGPAGAWSSAGANIGSGGGASIVDADLGGSYGGMTHPDGTIELDTWSTAQGYGWHILAHEFAHAFGQDHNSLDSILNTGQMYSMSALGSDDPYLAGEIFGVADAEGGLGSTYGGSAPTGGMPTQPGGTGTGGTSASNSQVNTQMTSNIKDVQNTGKATGKGASINVGGSSGGGGAGGGITQRLKAEAPPPAPGANELREWALNGQNEGNFDKLGLPGQSFQLGGTHYGYSPEAQQSMEMANSACGHCGVPNTYYGHSYREGCPEENNVDFWGSGGRGSPIDHACGDCINNAALKDPNITYTIWDGYLSDVGFWGDHYDHVHAAFCGGGGGNGLVCRSLKALAQTAMDAAQEVAKSAVSALGAPQPVQAGADWIVQDGWDAVEAWILEQMPVCGGSGGGECGQYLDDAIKQLGVEGQGFEESMPGLIQGESSGNPNAQNPSGATGCAQMMPDTFDAYKVSDCTDINDPLCNLMASMNYQNQEYQGPVDWTPAGYRNGGAIPNSGLLMAHGGERVLTAAQNRAFEDLIYSEIPSLGDVSDGGDSNVTVINNINNPQIGTQVSLEEFKREMEDTGYKSAVRVMKDVQDRRKGHSHRLARRQS